jgi:deoxyribonuclease-4
MKIGAHVSASGGISKAVDRGVEIGCEAIQIFGSSPQLGF